ncbi:MAG: ABC transporter permease [Caldilineaceae bacterium]
MGDLGDSIRLRSPVTELILDRFGSTLQLSIGGLIFALVIGLSTGIIAALRQNTWIDTTTMMLAYVGVSMPIFWLGLLLILVFAFPAGLVPAGGWQWTQLADPAQHHLGLRVAGVISRLTRSSLIEVMNEDYIRTAKAKGLPEWLLVIRHGLKNALIPVITMLGLQFGGMLAGAVVTETVFSRPGLGRLTVSAILWKDYPLVQGCVLFLAVVYLLVNLLVDVSYAWIDPPIHYE